MLKKFLLFIILISSLTQAQTKIPITMRLVEKGTTTGITAGEKVVFYTPKGNDTLITTIGGNVGGSVTDIKEPETTSSTTVRITKEGRLEGTEKVKNAKLFNILGQQLSDITQQLKLGKKILLQNLAAGIYFINIEEDNGERYTLKFLQQEGLVYGSSVYNKVMPTQITNRLTKTTLATVIDSIVVIDSYNVTRTKFDGLTTSANPINLGTKEVAGKVTLNIIAYGVDADSGKAPYALPNADVWTGTRDLSKAKYKGKTDLNGTLELRTRKGYADTLFIQASGHHQRNLLVNTGTDKNITEYAITDKVDIDFHNYVFHGNFWPLAKPDKKYGNNPTFQIINPIDTLWEQYTKDAIEKQIAIYTGGIMHGTQTTTNPYTEIGWKSIGGFGIIATNTNATQDTIYSSKIWFLNISNPTNEQYKKDMNATTKKEIANALFSQNDIGSTNVPISWKQSKWYQGIDKGDYIPVNYPEWTEWDLSFGRIAGKLPQGYTVNAIHKPNPQ